jgi:hypothetical protein
MKRAVGPTPSFLKSEPSSCVQVGGTGRDTHGLRGVSSGERGVIFMGG